MSHSVIWLIALPFKVKNTTGWDAILQLSIIVSARWVAVIASLLLSHYVLAADSTPQQQIQALISSTYDKPDHKVETSPIAVAEDYAIADWVQGKRGGRALLHRVNGKWVIMACGADGLKELKTLADAGIPKKPLTNWWGGWRPQKKSQPRPDQAV
jgi:hypothetical protein